VRFAVLDWSSGDGLPENTWVQTTEIKFGQANMLIVLVGRKIASASWVENEIAIASRMDIPVFGVYVDGSGPRTPLPPGLSRNRVVGWVWKDIGAAIEQMMGEGKNKS
jgi:hypothetical protein